MDGETKLLIDNELIAIDETWDDYARAAFRLASLVTDRLEPAVFPSLVAHATLVLGYFKPSGVTKERVDVDTLKADVEALKGLACEAIGRSIQPTKRPNPSPLAKAFDEQRATATCAGCGKKADVPFTEFVGREGPEAWFEVPAGWWLRSAGMSILRLRCNDCGGQREP